MTDFSRENLFTMSPKGIAGAEWDIFVFDGNTAGAAGIAEMLIQSHGRYIRLLPCLPSEWADGSFSGLCVRGGGEMSVRWEKSVITYASLKATADNTFSLQLPERTDYRFTLNDKKVELNSDSQGIITVVLKKNDLLKIEI